ncbi:MAG: hypothetical protein SFX18_09290 [Pirellulales bacterium]|nr:hypothetical protein [Pirellulales bacterium]
MTLAKGIGAVLILGGLLHLAIWLVGGYDWEGAVSPRKPALFGISAGVTVWSLAWVMSKLPTRTGDRCWSVIMPLCLFVEVALITLQYWRGVPSHFNHATPLDTGIESAMLALIAIVTLGIGWLAWRSCQPLSLDPAMELALRAGLWYLLFSCILGFVITAIGQANIQRGSPPEIYGSAGVLKYPHGVALHAIQIFPAVAWVLRRWQVPRRKEILAALVVAQGLLLVQAVWTTALGRSRLDLDLYGGTLLLLAGLCLVPIAWLLFDKTRGI